MHSWYGLTVHIDQQDRFVLGLDPDPDPDPALPWVEPTQLTLVVLDELGPQSTIKSGARCPTDGASCEDESPTGPISARPGWVYDSRPHRGSPEAYTMENPRMKWPKSMEIDADPSPMVSTLAGRLC